MVPRFLPAPVFPVRRVRRVRRRYLVSRPKPFPGEETAESPNDSAGTRGIRLAQGNSRRTIHGCHRKHDLRKRARLHSALSERRCRTTGLFSTFVSPRFDDNYGARESKDFLAIPFGVPLSY